MNVALDGVGAFDVPPHVSLQVLLQSPRIREPVGLELMSTPRAAATGINKCNQKHS